MSDYTCGNCKHFKVYGFFDVESYKCGISGEATTPNNTCDGWTDDSEVELTDEEKDAIEGDIECHRRLVEGGGD